MKITSKRFGEIVEAFPQLLGTLEKLEAARVAHIIGGSVALYMQGNARKPHDVDIMFTDAAHNDADKLFGITSALIERPSVTMRKSTPVNDGSIDFLSNYTLIAEGKKYHYPPLQKISTKFRGHIINFIPAEKIAAIKLLGRRAHHQDIDDVKVLLEHPSFDYVLFSDLVEQFDAQEVVAKVLSTIKK